MQGDNNSKNSSVLFDLVRWRDLIEILPKLGITIVGIAYLIGLLVLNIHIRQYGVYYLGFLQIEYVMAGVLWAFFMGLMYCFVYMIVYQIIDIRNKSKAEINQFKRIVKIALLIILALIFSTSIIVFIIGHMSESKVNIFSSKYWIICGVLILNFVAVFNITNQAKSIKNLIKSEVNLQINSKSKQFSTFLNSFLFLTFLLSALGLYANYVYPEFSTIYGGGRKQKAEFIVKADQVETINSIGISIVEDTRKIGPFEVIYESPEFFLICPPSGYKNADVKAIKLKKDLIDAVFYLIDK